MDFVNFDLATKLKEKGFEWLKISTYNPKTKVRNNHTEPTISQVLEWLRKEKKMHINIGIYPNGWKFYCCSCEKHNNGKFGDYDICEPLGLHNSYEAAAIAGIEYCLENLI